MSAAPDRPSQGILPLNGTKTHPLSDLARSALRDLSLRPMARRFFNAGLANRLERDGLVETVYLPSPFKIHKGHPIAHLRITDAGRREANR